jgi:hypothetical protein
LLQRGAEVRALLRGGAEPPGLVEGGGRLSLGDLKDGTSLDYACHGIDLIVASATAASRSPTAKRWPEANPASGGTCV